MKHTQNFTADASVKICEARRTPDRDMWEATVLAHGTFGGGSVAIQASPDGGTTKITLKDTAGTAVSISSDDVYNLKLGVGNKLEDTIEIYATLSGATDPDLTVDVFDNL